MAEETKEEYKPTPPQAGRIYGEIVYWGTVAGSVIAIIGSTIAVMIKTNVIEPSYVFSAILEGKDTAAIWKDAVGALPQGHWCLQKLFTGDGLTMFGLSLSIFSVIPGMFLSAILLLKEKELFFGGLAIVAGIISVVAFLGLISLPG